MSRPHKKLLMITLTLASISGVCHAQQTITSTTTISGTTEIVPRIRRLPVPHCGHVIELLISNRLRQNSYSEADSSMEVYLPHLTTGVVPGDLRLVSVSVVNEGSTECGPAFQIVLHNDSKLPIGNFAVSLVAVLGRIDVYSPTTTVRVLRMEAQEQLSIDVVLPATANRMGLIDQPLAAFDTLVVAVDSFDQLLECSETNNILVLKRSDIPPIVVADAQPTTPADSATVVPSVPQDSVTPDVVTPDVVTPSKPDDKPGSALDGFDVDRLKLDE